MGERAGIFKSRDLNYRVVLPGLSRIKKKKRQAIYIAPLQPPTLAAFRPWGGSAGAGRVRPAGCKCRKIDWQL